MRHIAAGFGKKTLGRIIISSNRAEGDRAWSQITDDLDLVFSTIQSATQENNLHRVENLRKQSQKGLIVVIDEAHHACAPTYIPFIRELKENGCPLLGLTATPIRMDEHDRNRLFKLFDGTIITTISKQDLIHRRILANPHAEAITTTVLESDIEVEGKELLNRFGELAQYVLERLAKNSGRNISIVKQYVNNQKKYGKTIVFAIDTLHATTLKDEFVRAGVKADVVHHGLPNPQAVERYRDRKCDDPQVLINVMMLTEGFDAPCTKTVFITCPTNSEVKVQQMCGRAMRGVDAGGNADAYLVSFVDTWKTFNPIEPNIILATDDATPEQLDAAVRGKFETVPIAEAIILEAYNLLRSRFLQGEILASYRYIPDAWYSWANEAEEGPSQYHMLVFAHQEGAFNELKKYVENHSKEFDSDRLSHAVCAGLISRFFHDCPDPIPAWNEIGNLVMAWARKKDVDSYTLAEKKVFDPRVIAEEIASLSEPQRWERLKNLIATNRLCDKTYGGSADRFMEDVQGKLRELMREKELIAPAVPPKFAKLKLKSLAPWPKGTASWNLNKIQQDVLNNPRHFPKGTPDISSIGFSQKPRTYCWALYSIDQNSITVDCKLNSPDVPLAILEFLVYHELLHADMPKIGHKGNFYERERMFVPSEKAIKDYSEKGKNNTNNQNWAAICDQFLYTWDRCFEHKGCKID